ncbi:MAG TPA: efflux RND transporter periplasmic adaptor subunit [candidate division Zixibacteria bacterium]|nr:efflux RND transporter periplasmic adaptor subunit [candidate division Zixibacteria bacterium]
MTEHRNNNDSLLGFIPRKGKGLIVFIAILVVVFSFGMIVSGGRGGESANTAANHEHSQAEAQAASSEPTTWTCSMHPQIKLSEPGKCPICFMDLIPLESDNSGDLGPRQLKMSETAKKLALIQTTPVRRAFAESEIRMNGRIAYDEAEVSYITAWVPGRLDKMFVDFTGETVQKGEHMVHIYSPELISAQEELLQAKQSVERLNNGSSVLKSTASLTLQSAREKLRLYGLTEGQIKDIEESEVVLEQVKLKSPVSGVVVEKNAKEGMYVKTGTQIYTIADLSSIWVLFDAYETDLPWLKVGQNVVFTSPSFPGKEFNAEITFIDPVINPQSRTARVRTEVDNPKGLLKPDMFVSGTIMSVLDREGNVINDRLADSESEAPLVIPASAPLLTGKRAVVYIELSDGDKPVFEGREVELGPRAGDLYVVKSGLSEGEMVVTNGAFKIDSELQIQARPSMMFVEGGGGSPAHQHGQQSPISRPSSGQKEPEAVTLDPETLQALTPVYAHYFDVQMALASDELDKATEAYSGLKKSVKNVDMGLFKDHAHMKWIKYSGQMIADAEAGIEAENIEESRDAFYGLSNVIIEMQETFGHASDQDYFLTFCPMARDNQGAYWLQTVDTVYNSFYGAMMLRCGEIKEKLSPNMEKTN